MIRPYYRLNSKVANPPNNSITDLTDESHFIPVQGTNYLLVKHRAL